MLRPRAWIAENRAIWLQSYGSRYHGMGEETLASVNYFMKGLPIPQRNIVD